VPKRAAHNLPIATDGVAWHGGVMAELTVLLSAARSGDQRAADQAFRVLYDELRRLARAKLRQHQPMTLLDTTSLVHESYLRFVAADAGPGLTDRHHFFAYCARVMRSVIVDLARARLAERRGGDAEHLPLDTEQVGRVAVEAEEEVVRVHEALEVLAQADEELARVVEMRYFGGLTEAEIAELTGSSERTVRRQWEKARLLLMMTLKS
jgi:RNA polymerase sigma factor (TIGR02999 family)